MINVHTKDKVIEVESKKTVLQRMEESKWAFHQFKCLGDFYFIDHLPDQIKFILGLGFKEVESEYYVYPGTLIVYSGCAGIEIIVLQPHNLNLYEIITKHVDTQEEFLKIYKLAKEIKDLYWEG